MSGHNKWSKIKHRKGAKDAKRGRLFSRLIKEITVAARMGGGDPAGNPRLRSAISAARGANMQSDSIDRAVKKGTGELEGVSYEELHFEGYGPEGVALMVDAMTDNTNRTVKDVRHLFGRGGGKMAEPGSVAWMFDQKGHVTVPEGAIDYDGLFMAAVEAGADDVIDTGQGLLVVTDRGTLYEVSHALEDAGIAVEEACLARVPQTTVEVTDVRVARRLTRLVDLLEDHEDVQTVWANFDVTDEVAAALAEDE